VVLEPYGPLKKRIGSQKKGEPSSGNGQTTKREKKRSWRAKTPETTCCLGKHIGKEQVPKHEPGKEKDLENS